MTKTVLLHTNDLSNAIAEVHAAGGHVTQALSPNVIVANLPDGFNHAALKSSTADTPASLDPISKQAVESWRRVEEKQAAATAGDREGLSWDAPGYQHPKYDQPEKKLRQPAILVFRTSR